jgi:hypothetical protein
VVPVSGAGQHCAKNAIAILLQNADTLAHRA